MVVLKILLAFFVVVKFLFFLLNIELHIGIRVIKKNVQIY